MSGLLNFDLTLPSRIELIDELCETVSGLLKTLGYAEDDVYAFDLSVREAVVNAMRHGNGFDPALSVTVRVEISDDDCTIRVGDSGKNGRATLKRLSDLLAPNGRGLLIMLSLMDTVQFARKKDRFEVVLRKRVRIPSKKMPALTF
jgi:serine/threonine-protein kinase RsbW